MPKTQHVCHPVWVAKLHRYVCDHCGKPAKAVGKAGLWK